MRKIWHAIRHRNRFEGEMAEEMRFHVESRARDLERSGHDRAEAFRLAKIEMGWTEHYKEACREARGLRWLDEFRADLLYALRGLRRNKVFAVTTVATLTLGIGANAAIFALVNSVLLKTLPVEDPEQLQAIYWTLPRGKRTFHQNASGRAMREGNLLVEDMFAYRHFATLRADLHPRADVFGHMGLGRINVTIGGQAQLARGLATSWNYFRALGVTPFIGRTFLPEDENRGATAPAALLGYQFWSDAFSSDPMILGKPLTIGDRRVIVVGVLPLGFHGVAPGESVDVAVTLTAWDSVTASKRVDDSRAWWVKMMARLDPSLTPAQLQSEVETRLMGMLKAEAPGEAFDPPKIRLMAGARGLHWLRSELEKPLKLVWIVALLILLMAAVNVGGLMLARSEARVAETGSRLALGAGMFRIARQHLTESVLIAGLGLVGGLLLAAGLGDFLPSLLPSGGIAPVLNLAPDMRFIAAAVALTATIAALFGLYPAWRSSRLDLTAALRRTQGARSGRLPMGRALVAAQIVLSLVLMIAAATFLRTVFNLRSLSLGFSPERLLVFSADPSSAGHRGEQIIQFHKRSLERLSALPAVRSVSLARYGLLQRGAFVSDFYYRDQDGGTKPLSGVKIHIIAPGYFGTVGIPLVAGRDIRLSDAAKAPRVVLVNQRLARMIRSDGGSPAGISLFQNERGDGAAEIVGIVGDAKYDDIREEAPATIYVPFEQSAIRGATFFVKSDGDPSVIADSVRKVMTAVDPRVPIYDMRTQQEQISLAMERERILMKLLTGFGSLALLLAAIGVYGVMSYSVSRRTSEIGIRLALGAAPQTVRRMVVRESMLPVVAGVACGLGASWWFTQLLESFLFGVKPMDAVSVGGAVLVLTAGAGLATALPAHRASRVAPANALRYE